MRIKKFYCNSGNATFPFERIQEAFIEQGTGARHSVASGDNTVFFLDNIGRIMRVSAGYSPQVISTRHIEDEISDLSLFSDAIGFFYIQKGHGFYVLTFPTGDITWVYDVSTQTWHKRKSYPIDTDGEESRWRANCYAFFEGMHIVGDWQNGKLYELDFDTYTDDTNTLRRYVDFPVIGDGENKVRHNKIQVDFEMGTGITTGQGSDPQAMLQWSDDNGKTWSNELWVTIGAMGKYGASAIWRRLGASKRRIYRVGVSDPIKVVITGAYLN